MFMFNPVTACQIGILPELGDQPSSCQAQKCDQLTHAALCIVLARNPKWDNQPTKNKI